MNFEVAGELAPPDACHCGKCRKVSGHYWASTDVLRDQLSIRGEDQIGWFRSSPAVRRGFCRNCGSPLFWDVDGRATIAISMGAFEAPTGTRLDKHIFVPDKGDYYDIGDALPRYGRSPEEAL